MATVYIVKPSIDIYQIDDSLLAAYVAAGWVQASATQYQTWANADAYDGAQGAPPAPALIAPATAPPPGELGN